MNFINISQETAQGDWADYIESKANSMKALDNPTIESYVDHEVYNPEVSALLNSQEGIQFISDTDDVHDMLQLFGDSDIEMLYRPDWLVPRFRRLKKKVKVIFCQVARAIEDADIKTIIKAVLIALVPMFTGGLPAALLPVLVWLVALLIKNGIGNVCPI
jgi:hypothetical protein